MTYNEFLKQKLELQGTLLVDGKYRAGTWKCEFLYFPSNKYVYRLYNKNGNKCRVAVSAAAAFKRMNEGCLETIKTK